MKFSLFCATSTSLPPDKSNQSVAWQEDLRHKGDNPDRFTSKYCRAITIFIMFYLGLNLAGFGGHKSNLSAN